MSDLSDLIERLRAADDSLTNESADWLERLDGVAKELQRKLLISRHYEPSPELAETDGWCKKHKEWTRLVDGKLRCDLCEIEKLQAKIERRNSSIRSLRASLNEPYEMVRKMQAEIERLRAAN